MDGQTDGQINSLTHFLAIRGSHEDSMKDGQAEGDVHNIPITFFKKCTDNQSIFVAPALDDMS